MTVKLDHITTIDFTPRTNLKGEGIGANWVFLLPHLDLHRVVCIGSPAIDQLPALQLVADELICTRPVADECVTVQPLERIPSSSVDLVYVLDKHASTRTEIKRILKPDGLVYYEYHGKDRTGFAVPESTINHYWLSPTFGNVQTAVPLHDARAREFLLRRELFTPTIRHQTLERFVKRVTGKKQTAPVAQEEMAGVPQTTSRSMKRTLFSFLRNARGMLIRSATRVERVLNHAPLTSGRTQRKGVILQLGKQTGRGLPDYLQLSARQHGIELGQWEWAFVARGDYPSQKLLFYLFAPNETEPSMLIKMVRDPQYNERLEREHQGLKFLSDVNFHQSHTIPNVLFQGYHHGLYFVAETVLDGRPFAQKTSFDADCQYARFVARWMTDLGVSTRSESTGAEIANLLVPIYHRFIDVYHPSPSQQQFLQGQLDRLSRAESIPLVLRHGDPGLQNLLIADDDTVAFLDWENAEVAGLSLWDMFYFLSAYCMKAGQMKSNLSSLDAYERYFLHESDLQSLISNSIDRYCEKLCLDRALIIPLYYMFWMYRALKQSTMIHPAQTQNALTWKVLQHSITHHDSPTLQLLDGLKSP